MKTIIKNFIIWLSILALGLGIFWYQSLFAQTDACWWSEWVECNWYCYPPWTDCSTAIAPSINDWSTTPASAWQWLIDLAAILDVIINVLYIIIRPLLAITGLALDNSLIYGGVFHMTDMLFRFWRIMMNISFILLALLILRDIASSLRKWEDMSKIIKDKLINRFLAWALIPASRWILGAILDISTLMIYQVWGIPLSVLGAQDNLNLHILQQSSIINLVDKQSSDTDDKWGYRFSSYFSCPGHIYLPCVFENNQIKESTWKKEIEGAKVKYGSWNTNIATLINNGQNFCVLSPTQLLEIKYDTEFTRSGNTWALATAIAWWNAKMESSNCGKIKELIDGSKSMVWPLYTIYWALLNFTSINVTTSSRSTEAEVVLFLIKGIAWVLLIIPLIALAFTSLARVGILRVVIAFSPFIVLYRFFGGKSKNKDETVDAIGKNMEFKFLWVMSFKPDISWIIQLIFQPVLVVLTLGISLIFLSAVNNMLSPQADKDGLMEAIGIQLDGSDPEYQSFKVSNNGNHTTDIKIKKRSGAYATDIFFDYFSRILANIFWIIIMWKMMFAALWSQSMTGDIVKKVQSMWENYINTRPAIGGYSRNSITKTGEDVVNKISENMKKDSSKDNADAWWKYITARLPGSQAQWKLNANFETKWVTTKEQALDNLSEWLTKVSSSKNDTFHYINNSDAPAFAKLASIAWIDWSNISEILNNEKNWNKLSTTEKGRTALLQFGKQETRQQAIESTVGINKDKQWEAINIINKRLLDSYIKSNDVTKDNNTMAIREIEGKKFIYETTKEEKDWKTNYYLTWIWELPMEIKSSEDAAKVNLYIKKNPALLSKLSYSAKAFDPTTWVDNTGLRIKDNEYVYTEPKAKEDKKKKEEDKKPDPNKPNPTPGN